MTVIDIINIVAAYLTAIISAIIGMGGGITLLAVMLLSMELAVLVPVHGAVQLVSNTSRLSLFWEYIRWPILARFAIGTVPFTFVGIYLFDKADPILLKILIGCFILFAIYFPFNRIKVSWKPQHAFTFAGMLTGSVSTLVGATGPIIAPFFLGKGWEKEQIIATKAACQAVVHLMKILLFGAILQFDFVQYGPLVIAMAIAVVLGTYTGKKILSRYVSERVFRILYKSILTLIAIKILGYDGLLALME